MRTGAPCPGARGGLTPTVLDLSPAAHTAWVRLHDLVESGLGTGGDYQSVGDVLKPGYADFVLRPCAAETLIAAIEDASERESVPPPAGR